MPELIDLCARQLMDTAPQIVQAIRVEMRLGRGTNISIPQFRVLRFIQRHPDSALTDLAEHLGLTPPSVSKLVEGLVKQKLVDRQESATDRRQLKLALTPAGDELVNLSRASAQASLVKTLSRLSDPELETIVHALELLNPLFVRQGKPPSVKEKL